MIESRHPSSRHPSATSTSQMMRSLSLWFVLPALLLDAARPTTNEDGRAAPQVRRAQSLDVATMHPGGALVRQRPLQKVEHNSTYRPKSSILQFAQSQKLKAPGTILQDEDLDSLDSFDQLNNSHIDDSNNELNLNGSENELGLNNGLNASNGIESSENLLDSSQGLHGTSGNSLNESTIQQHDNSPKGTVTNEQHEVEKRVETNDAHLDNGEERQLESSILRPIASGQEFKFAEAGGKTGDWEKSAEKMGEHVKTVESAWKKVDGKLNTYEQSIKDLSQQFKKLRDSAHGIHSDVLSESGEKEKRRMCAFANAEKVLKGEPEIDCDQMYE